MSPSQQRMLLFTFLAGGVAIVVIASLVALTRPQRDIRVSAPVDDAAPNGGFAFFDVDRATVLNPRVREALVRQLGSDAIAHSTPIDLTVVSPAFLREHLPVLHALNRGFNPPLGERREHDTIRLTYLRAQRRQMPFRHVELVFSSHSGLPLYFIIQPTAEFGDSVATLTAKYGPARRIQSGESAEPVHVWEQEGDLLVATTIVRRSGRSYQELRMYFVDNLMRLLERERQIQRREDDQTRSAGERAF